MNTVTSEHSPEIPPDESIRAHKPLPVPTVIVSVFFVKLCAMIDTGAQISLVSSSVRKLIRDSNLQAALEQLNCKMVSSIDGETVNI
jgi:hypothetical protein